MDALEITQKLISYPTITPKECGIFEYIKSLFPHFKTLECGENGVKNLFYTAFLTPQRPCRKKKMQKRIPSPCIFALQGILMSSSWKSLAKRSF